MLLDTCLTVPDTKFLKQKNSLFDGDLAVLPSCLPEPEFLIRMRKNSLNWKGGIQGQPNESLHSGRLPRRDFEKGMNEPFEDSLPLVFLAWMEEGFGWS